jgi:sodium ion-translocating decarboxylase beta subunit
MERRGTTQHLRLAPRPVTILLDILHDFVAFFQLTAFSSVTWQMATMWVVCAVLFYLGVHKKFEPLLLVPIAFGALLANLPTEGMITSRVLADGLVETGVLTVQGTPLETGGFRIDHIGGGLYDFLSQGIKLEIFPPLIFLGIGALTDFGPLIANPRTLLLGAAAQLGVLVTFLGAGLLGFNAQQSASIGIIGGADGPTAIFLTSKLAPELLGAVAVAAYTYMALVPLIQPPIMRALTTAKERKIRMQSLRQVSRLEKLAFALLVTVTVILLVPAAAPLIGMLMLGNFLRECGVTERLLKASQNEIINVVTIFLGTSVGITMAGENFLRPQTLLIIALGIVAFGLGTAGGVLAAKLLNLFSRRNLINPLIGSAGVSAVPMAARVSQVEGQKADPSNFLLMHAMGPNVAGVIGTAVIAGYYIATLGK